MNIEVSHEHSPLPSTNNSVVGGFMPVTSSFLVVPTTPQGDSSTDGFSFAGDMHARRAARGSASVASTPNKATERFVSPQRPTGGKIPSRAPRDVNTASLRYRRYAQKEPRYTDIPVAGPGGAAATEEGVDAKADRGGVASPVPAPQQKQQRAARSYFPRNKKKRFEPTGSAEEVFAGPGRVLVAQERNEAPAFPLMF